MKTLTIAICTYNRSDFLEICLNKLLPQVSIDTGVNVLVVDNNSTDNTEQLVRSLMQETPWLEYTLCSQQGLSYARNHALQVCDSPWLSFIDDDAYPNPDWITVNLRLISEGNFDAFGGVYLPWHLDGRKRWFKDSYETNASFMPPEIEKRLTPQDPYFSGGNCTFNVEKLRLAGGFSLALGMNGKQMGYGEEVAAQRTMAIAGARLGFSRELVIYHYVPLTKQRVSWAWKRAYKIGRDFWDIWGKEANMNNSKAYVNKKIRKSFKQTKLAMKKVTDSEEDYGVSNLLYDISGWAGVVGLIVGALAQKVR